MNIQDLENSLEPRVLGQLQTLPLVPGRPLLAVDADEVLVHFAGHLAEFVAGLGFDMRLTRYQLEGTIFHKDTGAPVSFEGAIDLINKYFSAECLNQKAISGAAEALARLSGIAQIVVLTNVPRHAREARIENLASLGMAYPVVENGGGKGKALAWMAAKVLAPVAFLDDSPKQIESAKRRVPEAACVQFLGSDYVARIIPESPDADHRVRDWEEAERVIRDCLAQ